jgi:hypothetical protein
MCSRRPAAQLASVRSVRRSATTRPTVAQSHDYGTVGHMRPPVQPSDQNSPMGDLVTAFRSVVRGTDFVLPTIRRIFDQLDSDDPKAAAAALHDALADRQISAVTREALLTHPRVASLPPARVAAFIAWVAEDLAGSLTSRQLTALVMQVQLHLGPEVLLQLPAPTARRMPRGRLDPALDYHLAVADQERFDALWPTWDGTVAELVTACSALGSV